MKQGQGRLAGKLALVTGATGGIGGAVAMALAAEGASIIATGRRESELRALSQRCEVGGGKFTQLAGDITDSGFVGALADASAQADILVHNAGILTYAPLLELTDAQCDAMFRVNVLAAIGVSQAMGAKMAARRSGHIVMMTSLAARNIGRYRSVYGATKHALAGFTKGLRIELQEHGIKVTEVAPGMVDTDMRDASTHPEVVAVFKSLSYAPLTPQDVAQAVVYAVTTSATCCPDLIELRPVGS